MTRPDLSYSGRLLVDTNAYCGLTDPNDGTHRAAVSTARQLSTAPIRRYTTNFIVAESNALILIRRGYTAALRFLDELAAGSTVIIRIRAVDEQRAQAIIRQFADKRFSFTDATSFAVMDRLRIAQAFTFDRNFSQFGLRMLPHV
ncbi:MAG TPA: VapC toxin family PIN domain ribonuclease [Dehalococcoidia bacterium]|jgi:predicted nucleic acid-binding protein